MPLQINEAYNDSIGKNDKKKTKSKRYGAIIRAVDVTRRGEN